MPKVQKKLPPKTYDRINPKHYQTGNGFKGPDGLPFQAIHVIELFSLGFHEGNAVKYLLRAGKKPDAELVTDAEKAIWYIQRQIKKAKKELGL